MPLNVIVYHLHIGYNKQETSSLIQTCFNIRILDSVGIQVIVCFEGTWSSSEPPHEKQTICTGKNKDADQLRGNREADQRLCFRLTDSTIPFLLVSKISNI